MRCGPWESASRITSPNPLPVNTEGRHKDLSVGAAVRAHAQAAARKGGRGRRRERQTSPFKTGLSACVPHAGLHVPTACSCNLFIASQIHGTHPHSYSLMLGSL
jgi:hypothetical protein